MLRLPFRHRPPPPRCSWEPCTDRPLLDDVYCILHRADAISALMHHNRNELCKEGCARRMLLTQEPALYGLCGVCQFEALMEGVRL